VEVRREKYPLQMFMDMLAKGGQKKQLSAFSAEWLRHNKYRGCTGDKAYFAYLLWRKRYEKR